MKKVISIILAVCSLAAASVIFTRAESVSSSKIMRGDVDGDGQVGINDVTAVQRHLAEYATLTGERLTAADVNADGAITIEDATMIQRFLAEYSDPYHIGEYIDETPELQFDEYELPFIS